MGNLDQIFSIEDSYLKIVEPGIQKEKVAIYRIISNKLAPIFTSNLSKYSIIILLVNSEQVSAIRKVIPGLIENLEESGKLHVVMEPLPSKRWSFITVFGHFLLRRYLVNNWFKVESYGIEGDPWAPYLVVSLKKNILKYVETVSFIYLDNPIKRFVKKLVISIFGLCTWKGHVVIVCSLGQDNQIHSSATS